MNYILYHKEIPVLNFEMDDGNYIAKINEVYNEKHAPVGVLNSALEPTKDAFREWWKSRSIPASRQHLKETLEILRVKSSLDLLKKCHGLSLSDHYWVKCDEPSESRLNWKDLNFFENNFSEEVGKILVGASEESVGDIKLLSPDCSTDGWLKKKWIVNANGERILLKGGSETFQQEPFNEAITSEICSRLKINHVDYSLTYQNKGFGDKEFFSACSDFVSMNTELVPAVRIFGTMKQNNNSSFLTQLLSGCKSLGMSDIERLKKDMGKMFALDFLIANTDRHFNNFGFLRNPDTLEWIGLAPVYDSGTSLFCKQSVFDLRNSAKHDSRYVETKPLAKTLEKQFTKALRDTEIPSFDFSSLGGIGGVFKEMLDQNPQNEGRSELLGKILDARVKETERFIEHLKEKKLSRLDLKV